MSDEKILRRRKGFYLNLLQTTLKKSGKLEVQTGMAFFIAETQRINTKQTTLDKWFSTAESSPFQQPESKEKSGRAVYVSVQDTISCIELTMKHDKRGYVVDWMKGEPKTESWDGSTDNRERTLEKHVSKYGWEF